MFIGIYYWLAPLVGVDFDGSGVTFALILQVSLPFAVLDVIVTVFSCWPGFPVESNVTLIGVLPPGLIGLLSTSGTVQPELPCAFTITKSASPIFLIINSVVTFSPSLIVYRSHSAPLFTLQTFPRWAFGRTLSTSPPWVGLWALPG